MRICILTVILSTLSCISYPRQVERVKIDFGYQLPLIKNPTSMRPFAALQELTIYQGKREFTFKMQIEAVDGEITVIGLTPVHSRSFLINYKQGIVDYEEHPFFRYPLSPEQMIADIQMAHIAVEEWQKHLQNEEILVRKTEDSVIFQADGKNLVEIIKNQEKTILIHYGFKCKIVIRNLSFEKL